MVDMVVHMVVLMFHNWLLNNIAPRQRPTARVWVAVAVSRCDWCQAVRIPRWWVYCDLIINDPISATWPAIVTTTSMVTSLELTLAFTLKLGGKEGGIWVGLVPCHFVLLWKIESSYAWKLYLRVLKSSFLKCRGADKYESGAVSWRDEQRIDG